VIRFAFISKVHAHLFVQGDKLTLRDNKAANGTFHNHKKLDPGGSRSVKLGDTLGFGALELELVDAGRLYQLLRVGSPVSQGAASVR
jgi:pSer/pThr/pTyr-binding forkhead associated (FHA) protein